MRKTNFVLPSQVKSMNYKIKQLFHKQLDYESQGVLVPHDNRAADQAANGIQHYGDFEYIKSLGAEVDNLRALLEADFKN